MKIHDISQRSQGHPLDYLSGDSISTPNIMTSEKTRLFAVIIGINSYQTTHSDLPPLRGAVPDALGFKKYMEDCLNVPTDQIVCLINKEATRSNIINALKGLREDKRIDKDDAIFLYYAGHGTEMDPPKGRGGETQKKIQAIVPYDCDTENELGMRVPPIPDYVLEILLSKIVETKGDNITVVFDCCHSASGTRGVNARTDEIARSVELPPNIYSAQLNQELSEVETTSRSAHAASKFSQRGLGSHILLSACGATQKANESGGRGRFSAALLKLLNQVSPDSLRYSDILRHPSLDPIPGQDPQCEGLHIDRTLFNLKVLPAQRKSFPISFVKKENDGRGQYVVHGGKIHNITLDSEFGVYRANDISFSTRIGTLHVDELQPFSFTAKIPLNAPEFDLTQSTIAVQTKFGKQEQLRIYVPPHDGFRKIYDELLKNSEFKHTFDNILRLNESQNAQIEVTLTTKNEVRFTMHTEVLTPNRVTMTQIVDGVEANPSSLAWIFSKMAHFYRELKYVNNDPRISRFIDVELYRLEEEYKLNEDTGFEEEILERVGPNLCTNGVVDLLVPDKEAEEVPYGIRLVNKSGLGLHANVFHFNSHDLCISSCATSHNGHTDHGLDIPLEAQGGSLEIGFGPAGYSPVCFAIANGLNVDVGFLKIYVSTQSANLAYLPQLSPFTPTRAITRWEPRRPKVTWTDIIVPIILRRHQADFTNLKSN